MISKRTTTFDAAALALLIIAVLLTLSVSPVVAQQPVNNSTDTEADPENRSTVIVVNGSSTAETFVGNNSTTL
jgi:hypothetical protein